MRKIRDSYSAQVWLEGGAVDFLDPLYPDDELSVQIVRFISDGMKRTRKHQSSASLRKQLISAGTVSGSRFRR